MTLTGARVGEVLEVREVGGERSFRRRLLELGLVPGTTVTFLGVAPLGDPVKLRVRGGCLSIRRAEADQIRVQATGASAPVPPLPASLETSGSLP